MSGVIGLSPNMKSGLVGVPQLGGIVKTTVCVRTESALESGSQTYHVGCETPYKMQNTANTLLLIGIGVINRGTQSGQGGVYYYLDSSAIQEYQNRSFNDNDEMPILNWWISGATFGSSTRTISLKIHSLSNNNKVVFNTGNGFMIQEIQGFPASNS